MIGSLLACASGGCNLDFSSLTDSDEQPRLGVMLGEEQAIVVVVPDCVGTVERITLVDSNQAVLWDVRSLAPYTLPKLFSLGTPPDGFLDVHVAWPDPSPMKPDESYQIVVGEAPPGDNSREDPTTTTSTTEGSTPDAGSGPSSSGAATPTTEGELFDRAHAVGSFELDKVTADGILVGSRRLSLEEFEEQACVDPDATTTTR